MINPIWSLKVGFTERKIRLKKIFEILLREGLKKINYGKFHTRGGVSEGHFPHPIFLKFFFAPKGLKIIFRHCSFFHV